MKLDKYKVINHCFKRWTVFTIVVLTAPYTIEDLKTTYDEKYAKTYGNYRIDRITKVVEEFLKCGNYKEGVARVKCQNPACSRYQTAGDFTRWNCHWHGLLLEGDFDEEGNFVFLPISELPDY